MAYNRTTWVNGETPLSADNMNNIENGIEENKASIAELNGDIKKIQYEDFVIASETYASGEAKMKTLKRTLSGYPFATAIVGASPTEHLAQYTVSSPSVLNAIASEAYISIRNGYAGQLTTALQIRLFSYTN